MQKEKWFVWVLLLFSLVFYSSEILAQQETPSERLVGAKALYLSSMYEDALNELQALKPLLSMLEQSEKVEYYIYLGSALMAFDRLDEAKEAFKQALLLDPNLTLDRTRFSPKIFRVFNEARAELPFGILSLKCDAFGATVYLDDKLIGTTPIGSIIGNLMAGEHLMKVSKPGYADWIQRVAIVKDQLTQVEVNLVAMERPPAIAAPVPMAEPPLAPTPPLPIPEVKPSPKAKVTPLPKAVEARPPRPEVRPRTWAWVTLGGGALLAGGAGVFAALGSSSYDKYQKATSQDDSDRYKAETIRNDWTSVGFGVGALISWGVSTYLFVSKPAPSPTAGVDLQLAVDPIHPKILAQVTF